MKYTQLTIILLFCFSLPLKITGQKTPSDKNTTLFLVSIGSGIHIPGGDLAERFGFNNSVDMSLGLLLNNRLKMAVEFDYHFGNNVKEDVLFGFRDISGNFISGNNQTINVDLKERIQHYKIGFYYTIPFNAKNKKSGFQLGLAPGFIQHFIKIRDDNLDFPQTSGDYKRGYDRLSNGFAITEYVGVTISTLKKNYNFNIGFEYTQGFTKNRRVFDYATFENKTKNRLDLLYGFKASWYLPIGLQTSKERVYY